VSRGDAKQVGVNPQWGSNPFQIGILTTLTIDAEGVLRQRVLLVERTEISAGCVLSQAHSLISGRGMGRERSSTGSGREGRGR
jgi:hypothetical protein